MLSNKNIFSTTILFAVALTSSITFAQPSVIPYNGRLEQDGQLVSDAMRRDLAFFIVNNEDANVPDHSSLGGALLWSEEHQNVPIAQGNFSVLLGEMARFNLAIFSQNPMLFLGVKVREAGGAWVELGGPGNRQRLVSAPFALVAQEAKEANDFSVRRNLTTTGNVTVTGETTLGETTVNGTLTANENRTVLNAGVTINGGEDSTGASSVGFLKISKNVASSLVSRSISFEPFLGPLSIPLPVDGPPRFTEVLEKHVCVVLQCLKGFYALPT